MSTPATLPANFTGWDKPAPVAASGAPPSTLPADFAQWDAPKAAKEMPQFTGPPSGTLERWRENLVALYNEVTNHGGLDEGTRKIIASPLSGAVRVLQGLTDVANPTATGEQFRRGMANVGGGALEASQIPGWFAAPEANEIGEGIAEAKTAMQTRRAAAVAKTLVNDEDEWRKINSVLDVPAKSVRISPTGDLAGAATMPGRTLAKIGLTSDTLKAMPPVQRMNVIAQHTDDAGKVVSFLANEATDNGVTLDAGKSALEELKRIGDPMVQDKAIDRFNKIVEGLNIYDFSNATPAEAWKLKKALAEGANFAHGDTLPNIRGNLVRAITRDLNEAVPSMKGANAAYSDLITAQQAARAQALKYAVSGPEPSVAQKALQVGKQIVKNRAVQVVGGSAIGAAGMKALDSLR